MSLEVQIEYIWLNDFTFTNCCLPFLKREKNPLSSQCEQTLGKVNRLSQEGKRGKSLPWPAIIWLWGR